MGFGTNPIIPLDSPRKNTQIHIFILGNGALGTIGRSNYIFGGFCSYVLGGVEKFFHLKNFIFPFVGYLVSFFLLKAIFKSFYISLIGAVFIYNPLFALTDVLNYFTLNSNIWEDGGNHLSYLAIKYPAGQFSLPIYFFGLLQLRSQFCSSWIYNFMSVSVCVDLWFEK